MHKKLFTFLLLIVGFCFIKPLHSQELYLKINGGYAIGTQKSNFITHNYYYSYLPDDSVVSRTVNNLDKFSFGQGVRGELSVGTFITKYFGFELTGFYGKSKKYLMESEENHDLEKTLFIDYKFKRNFSSSSFGFKPTLIFQSGGSKFRIYGKIGAIFSFDKITEEAEYRYFTNMGYYYPTWDLSYTFEYDRKLSLGYTSSLGAMLALSDDFDFFIEMNYNGVLYTPKTAEYTAYQNRGKDIINDLTTSEREYEFVDSYADSDNSSDNSPTKMLKQTFSFSNVVFTAGFKINLLY